MKNIISYIIVLLLAVSCQRDNSGSTIIINEDSRGELFYSQLFVHAEIVKLETTSECFISEITRAEVDEDRIFCLDSKLQTVFIYSLDGRFISKIGKKGKGPGEMQTARAFTIDRKNKLIEFLDATSKKLLVYNYNGKLLREQPAVYVSGFEKLGDNYIGYSYNSVSRTMDVTLDSKIFAFNKHGKLEKEYPNLTELNCSVNLTTHDNLVKDERGIIYFIPIFENSLFQIDNTLKATRICSFEFKRNPAPEVYNKNNILLLFNELNSQNYPHLIQGLKVSYPLMNFIFLYNNEVSNVFFNLETQELQSVSNSRFINDIALINSYMFRGSFYDGFFTSTPASKFLEQIEQANLLEDNKLNIPSDIRLEINENYELTSPGDNPILIFYTLKKK